jgi:hypothetical protein
LKRAQVCGAIAFYLDHQAGIDKYLEETEREFDGRRIPMSETNPSLWERIQNARAGGFAGNARRVLRFSLRFQADNDLRFAIVRAVRRQEPAIDFASAQEAGLDGLADPELFERIAAEGRILVSHDRRTMLNHFRNRLAAGKG